MRISVHSPEFEVTVTDDEGKVVLCYHATDYRFEADTVAFVKAIGEHAPVIREVAKKFEEL